MPLRFVRRASLGALTLLAFVPPAVAQTSVDDKGARAIFAELIGINTTHERGATTPAAQAVRRRLVAAGIPAKDIVIAGPHPARMNLVARLRGSGARKPIVLLAHLDVVEARREDWTLEPFVLTEKDGYFYGRGTSDIKDMAAIFVQTAHSAQAGEGQAGPGRDPRAHRRRGGGRRQRRAMAARQPPAAHRGGVRDQRRRRRPGDARRPGLRPERAGQREGVHGRAPRGAQSGRAQLAAGQGQRDLSPERRAVEGGRPRVPDAAQRGDPRLLHPGGGGRARHHRGRGCA